MAAQHRPDLCHHRPWPAFMHRPRVDGGDAQRIVVVGANADLNRAFGVDDPAFHRLVEHGAMVDSGKIIIGPGVGMGIEMQQAERAVFLGIGTQDRKADIVIAAQRQAGGPTGQNGADMAGQRIGEIGDLGIIERQIAIVGHGEFAQRVKPPAIGRINRLQGRGFADGTRAKAAAGSVRHRLIERDARHRHIHPAQVLGIAAAQERCRAAKGVFKGQPFEVAAGKGGVNLIFGIFKAHDRSCLWSAIDRPHQPAGRT